MILLCVSSTQATRIDGFVVAPLPSKIGNCHLASLVSDDMSVGRQPFSEFQPGPKNCGFILAPLFCLFVASCIGQEPIRIKVRLLNVACSARDSRGALLQNLTKDDVDVFEDAVPQQISFFAHSVDVPLTLGLIVDFSGSQDQFSKQHERDLQVFLKDVLGPKGGLAAHDWTTPARDGVFPTFSRHLPHVDRSVSSTVRVRSRAVSNIGPWIPAPLPRLAARSAIPPALATAPGCFRTSVAQTGILLRLPRPPPPPPTSFYGHQFRLSYTA